MPALCLLLGLRLSALSMLIHENAVASKSVEGETLYDALRLDTSCQTVPEQLTARDSKTQRTQAFGLKLKPSQSDLPSNAQFIFTACTPEEKRALSCLFELSGVLGDSSGGCSFVEWSLPLEQKIPGTKATPSLSRPTSSPPVPATKTSMHVPKQVEGTGESRQRRSLFNKSKYQVQQNDDSPSRSFPSVSIVPKIERARPSTRRQSIQNLSQSSPDLLSPQPTKSLLKHRCCGDVDSSASSCSGEVPIKRSSSSVSFSNLEIREYNIALSDHPDCSYGPPIQLGWEYCEQDPVSVDVYEENRSPRRRNLVHDAFRRSALLNEAGYTEEELQLAMEDVQRVKQERLRVKTHFRHRQQHLNSVEGLFSHLFVRLFTEKNRHVS